MTVGADQFLHRSKETKEYIKKNPLQLALQKCSISKGLPVNLGLLWFIVAVIEKRLKNGHNFIYLPSYSLWKRKVDFQNFAIVSWVGFGVVGSKADYNKFRSPGENIRTHL